MINLKSVLFFIIIQVIIISAQQRLPDDEVINFIKSKGYQGEAYQVITEDGYIIRLHHLHPRINTYTKLPCTKLPVFLMHSAFSNPIYFLNSGPHSSLGLFLSDNGYDVYLGNVRGSKFATAHKWLSTNSDDYWKFDFHEMGVYDLPPMIDLALQLSSAPKIFYVGHSQSCPQALALLSLRPEYNNKIAQSHLFAPVANMMHIRPSAKAMVPIFLAFTNHFKNFTHVNLTPFLGFGSKLSDFLCTEGIRLVICQMMQYFMLGGLPFEATTDPEVYRLIIPSLSPEIAVQQVTHYAQNIISGKFELFNYASPEYGFEKNLRIYGSFTPPEYPLQNIVSPVYLWASENDFLNTIEDVKSLIPRLRNVHFRPIKGWNHIDYIYARDAREKLYQPVIREFERYNG